MASWARPSPAQLDCAIGIYLRHAYVETVIPSAVSQRIAKLTAEGNHVESTVFERSAGDDPVRFSARLGNRCYPHMKLVVERSPDGVNYLLRADTHDRHIQPAAGSKEADAFRELMAKNQAIADAIESAWEHQALPTFKQYLRADVARRRRSL